METFLRAIDAYQRFDPAGWVSLFRFFPAWAGVLLLLVGVGMMLYGGGRLFRLVAGPLGAVVGVLWAPVVAGHLGYGTSSAQIRTVAAITLAGVGFLFPPGATFFAFGLPVGLACGEMAGSDWLLGFIPGMFIGGVMAVASSLLGGWVLVLGLLSMLAPLTSLVESVAQQPWGVMIATFLFAVAGTVYQLFVRLSPEARAAIKVEKALAKKKLAEAKALEARWETYSKDKGLD